MNGSASLRKGKIQGFLNEKLSRKKIKGRLNGYSKVRPSFKAWG